MIRGFFLIILCLWQTEVRAEPLTTLQLAATAERLKEKKLENFVSTLKDWEIIFIPNSKSIQNGPRVLARSPDNRTTVGFNLRPSDQASSSVEIKEYDSTPGNERFVFSEIHFEENSKEELRAHASDPEAIRKKIEFLRPDYQKGLAFHKDIGNSKKEDCLECHRGGQVRFNATEAEDEYLRLSSEEKEALLKLVNESPRLKAFEAFRFQDRAKFEEAMRKGFKDYRESQIAFSSKIVARKIAETFESEPQVPFGLMAIVKGCSNLENLFGPKEEWQRRVRFFANLKREPEKSKLLSQWGAEGEKFRTQYLRALSDVISDTISSRSQKSTAYPDPSDTSVDDEMIAKLRLYWDPLSPKILNDEIERLRVGSWPPGSAVALSLHFGPLPGTEDETKRTALSLYLQEIKNVSVAAIDKKLGVGTALQMSCEDLGRNAKLAILEKQNHLKADNGAEANKKIFLHPH